MKVLLYFEGEKVISKSGIGRAMKHQMAALTSQGIPFTCDPEDEDYDIAHINTIGPASGTLLRVAHKAGKRVIYHAHSTEEDFRNSFLLSNQLAPVFKKRLVYLYSRADRIITPTPYSKSLIEGYEGIDVPVHAISNGIDLERFNYNEKKIMKFRRYFNLANDRKVVISVGLFFERKGILDFIEVAKNLPQYTFIWFGHVALYSIPNNIRQIVMKDHPENVIFPGYISGDIIEGAYGGANAFFFPSKEETEGIVVLEALASRQQVILRDIPVFDPWMRNGVNCYKGNDVESFTQLVQDVVEKRLPSLRDEARKTAEDRDINAIGKQLKAVYEQVMNDEIRTRK